MADLWLTSWDRTRFTDHLPLRQMAIVYYIVRPIKGEAVGEFNAYGNPAPPWLADLARAVSGIPRMLESDDDAAVLSDVFKQAEPMAPDTPYSPYDKVWKHFLQEQTLGKRPRAEKATSAGAAGR
jgi:hypothetical protein